MKKLVSICGSLCLLAPAIANADSLINLSFKIKFK